MTVDWRQLIGDLTDPVDGTSLRLDSSGDELIGGADRRFRLVRGQPNLLPPGGVRLGGWDFPPIRVDDADRPRPAVRSRPVARALKGWFAPVSERSGALDRFRDDVTSTRARPRVLVVGGATIGEGLESVVDDPALEIVSFDIYPTDDTTFVADAHRIPLADGTMDAVCVQAVLEHVYRPDVVIGEIRRILRPGGLVYAETPFLQPVHEGAFDFTRFTVSGHTLLFDGFTALDTGPIGGPAAALHLAVRGIVQGLTRSRLAGKLIYATTLPLRVVDRLVDASSRRDFCVGAYYLGRSTSSSSSRAIDPVELYLRGHESE